MLLHENGSPDGANFCLCWPPLAEPSHTHFGCDHNKKHISVELTTQQTKSCAANQWKATIKHAAMWKTQFRANSRAPYGSDSMCEMWHKSCRTYMYLRISCHDDHSHHDHRYRSPVSHTLTHGPCGACMYVRSLDLVRQHHVRCCCLKQSDAAMAKPHSLYVDASLSMCLLFIHPAVALLR